MAHSCENGKFWAHDEKKHLFAHTISSYLPKIILVVAGLASAPGFSEQTSFSRFFKQRTGMPPSEYRERKDVP
jgi:AraC-like DNA-binding protein